ncbi:glycosyltransferase [Paenibacillus shunpengii]|uniref:Glycosyltransferase n=1 Tax=Paenibacillus shunpengii TaxID=2054424 RepID=A0ABW5SX59_9BACL
MKILVGSPVHQKPNILNHFLKSLLNLNKENIELHYLFVDDNESIDSMLILEQFSKLEKNVTIYKSESSEHYDCNEETHIWNEQLIWKVANFKNMILRIAEDFEFDYLFLIDSDLVLHPDTLQQLLRVEKDIISNIFWTKWQPDFPELPQVWLFDQYQQYNFSRGEVITEKELIDRNKEFLSMLRNPGVYEVGGLGACTLISKNAIKKGVNFSEIKNISFWGEDRHFCIRAQALGMKLYVDTHYPAYHIYRECDLINVPEYNLSLNNQTEVALLEDLVINGMESLGTFHYKNGYPHDWKQYFSEEIKSSLLSEMDKEYKNTVENKIIVNATILNTDIEMDANRIYARFSMMNDGVQNGLHFMDEVQGIIYFSKGNNQQWLIDSIAIEEN